jgi:D-3-phosphoglycerate dehydrogenase
MYKVLVCDGISEEGARILNSSKQIQAVIKSKLPREELLNIVGDFHALSVRSATKVDAEVIEKATNLKIVGRAGIGVDNIDVPAATKRGIVVMNTPGGNTVTTAEHAVAMIMALTRHIPQATASIKAGKWEKNKFMGRELYNKTLGVLGLGNIGSIVADRARGLKMNVIAYDPFITAEAAAKRGVELVGLEELYERSHYITIHVPKLEETKNLINKDTIAKMKNGVFIINCARGGIVNETDLYDALLSKKVAGAAFDVFQKEPVDPANPLLTLDNFICTPHLGASTEEAQVNVSIAVAEQIVDYLERSVIVNAVNVPSLTNEELNNLAPYLKLSEGLGSFISQVIKGAVKEISIEYSGEVADKKVNVLTIGFLKGFFSKVLESSEVNYVNAPIIAKDRGINISEIKSESKKEFNNLITVTAKAEKDKVSMAGTIFGREPRIVRINNFYVESVPEGHIILLYNNDRPGVIGNIGTTLGKNEINIGSMSWGRDKVGGMAVSILHVDQEVGKKVLEDLKKLPNIVSVSYIEI